MKKKKNKKIKKMKGPSSIMKEVKHKLISKELIRKYHIKISSFM